MKIEFTLIVTSETSTPKFPSEISALLFVWKTKIFNCKMKENVKLYKYIQPCCNL